MLVGLTGNFGTGKSTVLSLFEKEGALTLNADKIVSGLYENAELKKAVSALFGNVLAPDGAVDKKKIADIVFKSPSRRKELESLLHRRVISEIESLSADNKGKIIIAEIPLLFEGGYDTNVDSIILTTCSRETIFGRLREKGYTDEEIDLRLKTQIPDDRKIDKADFIIDTEVSINEIVKRVKSISEILKKKLSSQNQF